MRANDQGLTSLHWVALNGRSDIAEALLNCGAEVNPAPASGAWPSPAGIALLMGYHELYDLLSMRGGAFALGFRGLFGESTRL